MDDTRTNNHYIVPEDCEKCPLYLSNAPCVAGTGPVPAEVMLVGEAPGQTEARTGIPFVGSAGKKLDFGLQQAGLDRNAVHITNAVLCHPTKDGTNRTPTTTEIKLCKQRLINEIKEVNPKVIVLLGKIAMSALLKGSRKDITKVMGQEVWSEEYNAFLLPVLHPAALLYAPNKEQHFMRHLAKIPNLINYKKPYTEYHEVYTLEDFDALMDYLKDKTLIAFDIETNSTTKAFLKGATVTAVSFSAEEGKAFTVPLFYKERLFTSDEIYNNIIPKLRLLLEDPEKTFVGHNIKFDIIFMRNVFGIEIKKYEDTIIGHYLLDENSRHGLKSLASDFTDLGNYSQDFKEDHLDPFMLSSPDEFYKYSCGDADATLKLYNYIIPRLKEEDLVTTYRMVVKFSSALADVEYRGAKVDKAMLDPIKVAIHNAVEKSNQEIRDNIAVKAYEEDTQKSFNPRSTKQLRELLFDRLKLPVIKVTDKEKVPCTDKEVLIELSKHHPLPASIYRGRKLNHLLKSFILSIEEHIQDDGRIHTSFNIAHTKTGRLSSSDPNLQNLPAHDDSAKFVKRLFIPSQSDGVIIDLDYSQIELRVLAMLSAEPKLIDAYNSGEDIHRKTAESIFRTKDITKEMRAIGKKINFSVIYGEGAKELASELDISVSDAKSYISNYFAMYPRVDEYIAMTRNTIRKLGYVRSPLGRYRRLPEVFTTDDHLVSHALRQGVNFTIQSTASDITQTALYKINNYLKKSNYDARVVLTVHDSIVLECAIYQIATVFNLCLKIMSSVKFPFMTVPIEAEGKVGWNYADTIDWDGQSMDILDRMTDAVTDAEHVNKLIDLIGIIDN